MVMAGLLAWRCSAFYLWSGCARSCKEDGDQHDPGADHSLVFQCRSAAAACHVPLAIGGWIFVIGLMVYVTVVDIGRLAG